MSVRVITVQLPAEPPIESVIIVELANQFHFVDGAPLIERIAFQRRRQERAPAAWHMVGADPLRPGLSWAEVIARADGRPILVLWEPDEAVA